MTGHSGVLLSISQVVIWTTHFVKMRECDHWVLQGLSQAVPLAITLKPCAWQAPTSLTISTITLEAASDAPLYTKITETQSVRILPQTTSVARNWAETCMQVHVSSKSWAPRCTVSPSLKSENKCPRLSFTAITALLKQTCPMRKPKIIR